jgi:hypothetical protein
MVVLLLAAGAVQLGIGGLYTEPAILVAAFLLGIASQSIKICVDTIVQEEADDAFRGRVFSIYDVVFNGAFVAAAAIAAVTLPPSGRSPQLLVAIAIAYVITAIGFNRASSAVGSQHPQ